MSRRISTLFATAFAVISAASISAPQLATAANDFGTVYSFAGPAADGSSPNAGVTLLDGTLYGTTSSGGANGQGVVYSLTGAGAENVLYSFPAIGNGSQILSGLTAVGNTLYGETSAGGANGTGSIFSITPDGTEKTIYSFGAAAGDGSSPNGGLTLVGNTLYGTTSSGGANSAGTIFSVATDGTEKVLYSFAGGSNDGANPMAGLAAVGNTLYGTTQRGGSQFATQAFGTVFSFNLMNNTEAIRHFFFGPGDPLNDGSFPLTGVTVLGSRLYGVTSRGGTKDDGTVFSMNLTGNEGFKILHSFTFTGDDGNKPVGGLTIVGSTVYGTTAGGGTNGNGTIFSLGTDGSNFATIHNFAGNDGILPYSNLLQVGPALYGTTNRGGANGDFGTVYSISVPEPATWTIAIASLPMTWWLLRRRATKRT